jgi:hypothetical protein
MTESVLYRLGAKNSPYRKTVAQHIIDAEDWAIAKISPPSRNLDQNARFHAMCGDISKQCKHVGRKLSLEQWKTLLVSAHAVATNEGADMVPGIEGEYVNLRESTARMSIRRMASLITYVQAYGDMADIKWSEPVSHFRREG